MSDVIIVMHAEVPPVIAKLAHDELSEHEFMKQVIFTTNVAEMDGSRGYINLDEGTVIIDLAACVKDLRWMEKGATFITNAWFNVLYAILHEAQHAWQEDNGWIRGQSLKDLEEDADKYAMERMIEWCMANPLPTLEGWIGERIKATFNAMYASHTSMVERELEVCGKAAASVFRAGSQNGIDGKNEVASLLTAIEDGRVEATRLAGELYLSAANFMAMNDHYDEWSNENQVALINLYKQFRGGKGEAYAQ